MQVKIAMMSAGKNREREVLRCMQTGVESKLLPDDRDLWKGQKQACASKGEGFGVVCNYDERIKTSDVGIFIGSWKARDNIHHNCRNSYVQNCKVYVCIETSLLTRVMFREDLYHRVGVDGFLNGHGWFRDHTVQYPQDRWDKLGMAYEGWKKNRGPNIVVALQLPGDASLRNNDINEWCIDTVNKIRQYSDRPIQVRLHPGISGKGLTSHDPLFRYFALNPVPNLTYVDGKIISWKDQLESAHCVVSYTSGLSIDSTIYGVPVIACDAGNFAWGLVPGGIESIEDIRLPREAQIQNWLYNLAYSQWSPDEMLSGECWEHLYPEIQRRLDKVNSTEEG